MSPFDNTRFINVGIGTTRQFRGTNQLCAFKLEKAGVHAFGDIMLPT